MTLSLDTFVITTQHLADNIETFSKVRATVMRLKRMPQLIVIGSYYLVAFCSLAVSPEISHYLDLEVILTCRLPYSVPYGTSYTILHVIDDKPDPIGEPIGPAESSSQLQPS